MRVGEAAGDSTLENALSMAQLFDLRSQKAVEEVRRVARVVAGWREHFASCGVTPRDLELLAEQIDRPFLADQRREYS